MKHSQPPCLQVGGGVCTPHTTQACLAHCAEWPGPLGQPLGAQGSPPEGSLPHPRHPAPPEAEHSPRAGRSHVASQTATQGAPLFNRQGHQRKLASGLLKVVTGPLSASSSGSPSGRKGPSAWAVLRCSLRELGEKWGSQHPHLTVDGLCRADGQGAVTAKGHHQDSHPSHTQAHGWTKNMPSFQIFHTPRWPPRSNPKQPSRVRLQGPAHASPGPVDLARECG